MSEIKTDSYSAQLWIATGKELTDLEEIVLQIVQEEVIKFIEPSKEQINCWKASENGKMYFQEHVNLLLGKRLTLSTLDALWRNFTKRSIKNRQRKVIIEFQSANKKQECAHCSSNEGPFHVDHIIPLAKGGFDIEENLQFLCEMCNLKKGKLVDKKYLFI